jgi:PA domain
MLLQAVLNRRMLSLSLEACLVLLSIQFSAAEAYMGTTHVNIHIPASLSKDGGYQHSLGHFGTAAMTRAGHVYTDSDVYGGMNLAVMEAPVNSSDLCHHLDESESLSLQQPHLLVVHRSPHCSFVTQTRRAQHMGAAGLIIVDNTCVCEEEQAGACVPATNGTACQMESPVVKDDGSGGDVSIPAILLKRQDGDAILKTLQDPKQSVPVWVNLKWQSKPTAVASSRHNDNDNEDKLYYGMWLDLQDLNHTQPFTMSIWHIALAVGQHAHFYPSYMFYNGTQQNCVGHTSAGFCDNTCTNNGRYCYPSPNGVQIITEIAHRLCVWKNHGDESKDYKTDAFWRYVLYFDQHCAAHAYGYNATHISADKVEACRQEAYANAKISATDVHNCIEDSGGVDMATDRSNSFLEEQLADKDRYGVFQTPSIWVNGKVMPTYWRAPSATTLLEAICAGFQSSARAQIMMTVPEVCGACLGKGSDENQLIQCSRKHIDTKSKPSGGGGGGGTINHGRVSLAFKIIFWLSASAAIVGAIRYGHKKYRERLDTNNNDNNNPGLFNALGSRLMDPIFSYMPLHNNHDGSNNNHNRNGGLINGVLRGSGEENITFYD